MIYIILRLKNIIIPTLLGMKIIINFMLHH